MPSGQTLLARQPCALQTCATDQLQKTVPRLKALLLRRKLPAKFGELLSEEQLKEIEELGLLADLDDQVRSKSNS